MGLLSDYLDWVREGYQEYADALEEEDVGIGGTGIGGDVELILGAGVDAATSDITRNIVDEFSIEILGIIEFLGIAILNSGQKTMDYLTLQLKPRRVEAVSVATAMTIYTVTAFTIFNQIKKA